MRRRERCKIDERSDRCDGWVTGTNHDGKFVTGLKGTCEKRIGLTRMFDEIFVEEHVGCRR